jgi:hypothetical protein
MRCAKQAGYVRFFQWTPSMTEQPSDSSGLKLVMSVGVCKTTAPAPDRRKKIVALGRGFTIDGADAQWQPA